MISSYAPGERKQLREISGKTLEGKPLDLADYKAMSSWSTSGARTAGRAGPRRPIW
ncbi:hypothetical protein SAZ11_51735 [Streptomyces sp. FXJ1.4098]|nr:hypothetical protein [Streptomyces sp. FXJ1.4098]